MAENTQSTNQITISLQKSEIELLPVKELLGRDFFIPGYQRGYRWTKRQVDDLLDDILEFMDKPPKEKEIYCLQPLVVKYKGKDNMVKGPWEVIDGQQRLTTIKILLAYLEYEKSYSIEYETRKKEDILSVDKVEKICSKKFLDSIKSYGGEGEDNEKIADSNIDFYHMREVWKTIDAWFKDKCNEKARFTATLLTHVQFIWYETRERNPIKVFTRLNIGKIPLTDSELVKALFLNHSNFEGVNNEETIRLQQAENAAEWDGIEYAFQDDEFWLFINDVGWEKPTRIDFILDLIQTQDDFQIKQAWMNSYKRSEDDWNKCLGTDEHRTFRYFYELFKLKKTDIQNNKIGWRLRDDIWHKIKDYFQIFDEWFNDLQLYHYIGFLIQQKTALLKIVDQWKKEKNKESFLKILKEQMIKSKIGACRDLTRQYGEVGEKKRECFPLLLLFNIQTVIDQNKELVKSKKYELGTFYKFPFHLFKKEDRKKNGKGWEIEHIASNAGDNFSELKEQMIYLAGVKYILPKNSPLNVEIQEFLGSDAPSGFDDLMKKIEALAPGAIKQSYKNYIWNFALLDSSTNEEYQNAPFPIKRICLLAKERGEKAIVSYDENEHKIAINTTPGIAFVPPCTRDVFTKAYTDVPTTLNAWTDEDAKNYLWRIYDVLSRAGFLDEIHGENGQKITKKEYREKYYKSEKLK